MSIVTRIQNAAVGEASQSWVELPSPSESSPEFTSPGCGEIWYSLTNNCATATVGSTIGKKTRVRTSPEARRR